MDNSKSKGLGLVSIITPTYNGGKYISETIDSVIAQTYQDWEMIIVDDCSTDNTREIVERYDDKRIKYFCLERNSGAAIARNTALRLANGRWIAFLDSDDLWFPEKLSHQIQFMLDNDYAFTSTERIVINEESKNLGRWVTGPSVVSKFGMYCYCWIGCLTVMYDREKIGLVQIPDLKKNNDYAMWLKVVQKSNCHLLREKLSAYRIRKGSISHQPKPTLIKWHFRLFRKVLGMNPISALFFTSMNIVCNRIKKRYYIHQF